jgi:hypothetical protein
MMPSAISGPVKFAAEDAPPDEDAAPPAAELEEVDELHAARTRTLDAAAMAGIRRSFLLRNSPFCHGSHPI